MFAKKSRYNFLKLRAFSIRVAAANPCAAKNMYLSLQSALPITNIKQNQVYPTTADSNKLNAHKWMDVSQQDSTNISSQVQPIKPADISQSN